MMQVELTVNGEQRSDDVEPRLLLVHYLREVCGLRAANVGCDTTSCGACTVLLNGESVKSCTVLAVQAAGKEVVTAEGLAPPGELHPVQAAFRAEHGLQCGFCTPGMVMAAVSLLAENPSPTEQQVREGLEGNLCRCTGYHNIVRAVLAAAGQAAAPAAAGRPLRPSWGDRMIPAPFDYVAAESAAHAIDLLADHGDDAKVLAGGHSLLPMMKLRLAAPEVLIDIAGVTELAGVAVDGDELVIGATTRHADLAGSALVRTDAPLLAHAASLVGDPQIRHRGTIGGSLAHADPAADLPMALVALGGSVELRGARRNPPGGRRRLLHRLLRDLPGAWRAADRGPRPAPARRGWGYQKFTRRANDWAIVGAAAIDGRIALANMGPMPIRARAAEEALAGGASVADAAALAAEGTSPGEDIHADRGYREHLARVLTRRALEHQA